MHDVEVLLRQMTVQEKVAMLAGTNTWYTVPVERVGIPSLKENTFSAPSVVETPLYLLLSKLSSATTVHEAFVIRPCYINPRTTLADVDALVDEVETCGAQAWALLGGRG